MKKVLTAALLLASIVMTAQTKYTIQTACHPADVKGYDTETLRARFMMPEVMVADEIRLTYSMYDRFIFGGAVPATKPLKLETIDPLKAPYFLFSRELGVINVGGEGIVTVNGKFQEQGCRPSGQVLPQFRHRAQGLQDAAHHHRRPQGVPQGQFFCRRQDGRLQRPRH